MVMEMKMKSLAEHFGVDVNELKQKSYLELELMFKQMEEDERAKRCDDALKSEAYTHLIKQYFTPFEFLRQWFSEEEIIRICALNDVAERDLCEEEKTTSDRSYHKEAEFIRNDKKRVPKNSNSPACNACVQRVGNECAYGCPYATLSPCSVFRVKHHYQGLRHGKVILDLLYGKYPELKQFEFAAYEYHDYERLPYEIYPKNHIYTPFEALMSGDIEAIKERNRRYAKAYNGSIHTPDATEKRLEENQNFFEVIVNLPR